MQDQWTDRLSDFVDGDLPEGDRAALEQHLATCADCRTIVDELAAVQAAAKRLPVHQPSRDLWPGIEVRLERPTRRRVSFSLPAAIAAGLFISIASALGTWVVIHKPADAVPSVAATRTPELRAVALNSAPYDRAIADLLTTLRTERKDLNPKTIETIERSLAAIDRAIADARLALDRDPTDVELVTYLSDRQRARLAVLRQVERFAPEAP